MNNINNPNQTRRGRMSIGSAAARGREELEKFEEKERIRKEAVKKEKESLERQLSQLESQARQAARAENLKEEKVLTTPPLLPPQLAGSEPDPDDLPFLKSHRLLSTIRCAYRKTSSSAQAR